MDQEQDKLLGHADDNDGIDEYDNQLPTWWVAMFAVCIIWSIAYSFNWHFLLETSQAQLYEEELQAAAEAWPAEPIEPIQADQVQKTPEALASGKDVYDANCLACHGPTMEGGIGPSFVDEEWIHGGSLEDIIKVITNGVPEKGMITWGPVLGPQKIAAVAAYIHENGNTP